MRRISIAIAFVGFNLMACCCAGVAPRPPAIPAAPGAAPAAPAPAPEVQIPRLPIDYDKFAERFGKPSFTNDGDRRRMASFDDEKVRLIFIPAGEAAWKISEILDNETGKPISESELLQRLAKRDAEKIAADARIAAESAIIEAAKPKITRANYHKIADGMTLAEAQQILGPGKEDARSGGLQIVTWQSVPAAFQQPTIITITFQNNRVKAKAVIGP